MAHGRAARVDRRSADARDRLSTTPFAFAASSPRLTAGERPHLLRREASLPGTVRFTRPA